MISAAAGDALLTDLYELTMAAGYFEHRLDCRATFELFVRSLPPERTFLLACGLESAVRYLEDLRFTDGEIAYLRAQPVFRSIPGDFFDYLRSFRFTGDVAAVPEGTVLFAEEPLVQISAPIAEAQIVETYLLSVLNFETLVASKAARVVRAAGGRGVLEFGTRRAQGPEAGVRAARSAYIAGCEATSNVFAARRFGIPLAGTAAHSWTQAFSSELESFQALVDSFPDTAILLIDTYDPVAGAELAAGLGRKIPGVRLDSGDLIEKSRHVRKILDRHGHHETRIIASGDLNEYKIANLMAAGAPIDLFGVGTEMVTSRDVPSLSVVYKLVEIEIAGKVEYKTKFSEQKAHSPGRKQVYRFEQDGCFHHDLIARADESYPNAAPLLQPVMKQGRRLAPLPGITSIRARVQEGLRRLPSVCQAIEGGTPYPVGKSAALQRLEEEVRELYFRSVGGQVAGNRV